MTKTIFSGEETDWTLPSIENPLASVVVTFDPLIASYMEFNDQNLKVSYSGEPIDGLYGQMTVKINLVIDYADEKLSYTQIVFLFPEVDSDLDSDSGSGTVTASESDSGSENIDTSDATT